MTFTTQPELSSAITNLVNGLLAIFLLFALKGMKKEKEGKILWAISFVLFLISSFVGAVVHGFVLSDKTHEAIWIFLNFNLCLTLGAYSLCIWYETYGYKVTKKLIPIYVIVCLLSGYYNNFMADSYTSFIIFSVVCLLILLIILILNIRKKAYLAVFILAIIILAAGSYLQTLYSIRFRFILLFDNNGLYHIFLLVFALLNYLGILLSTRSDK